MMEQSISDLLNDKTILESKISDLVRSFQDKYPGIEPVELFPVTVDSRLAGPSRRYIKTEVFIRL